MVRPPAVARGAGRGRRVPGPCLHALPRSGVAAEMEQQRMAEERLRVRQRRKRRRVMRARVSRGATVRGVGEKRKRKGLGRDHGEGMTQTKIGDAKRATVQVDSDTDPESDGSDSEGKCQPRLNDGIAAQHARDLADMQVRAGRARARLVRGGVDAAAAAG